MASIENTQLCPDLKLFKKGKVREVYDLDNMLLIVATDRISAFDVILPDLIAGKGKILNKISNFWFDYFKNEIPNHIITADVTEYPKECQAYAPLLNERSVLVWKTELVEIEAIVRGYLSGSGFRDYQNTGEICGIQLPEGLVESAKLESAIFTPSTKAQVGHDINIDENQLRQIHGNSLIEEIKQKSLQLYTKAAEYALKRGIIIADTKFEFGLLGGEVILIDEILTPDSSRFWPAEEYTPGQSQNSYDKQIVRDYLLTVDWNKTPPGPKLPDSIIQKSLSRYEDVYQKLSS
jgi:phosphoribosylaminoimidazole-succinocarboxamide synthase